MIGARPVVWRPTWDGSGIESAHGTRVENREASAAFRETVTRDGGEVEMIDGFLVGWRRAPTPRE